jgi:hypothetical protein
LAVEPLFAVVAMRRKVDAQFAADGSDVPSFFGAREITQQFASNRRIVWVPGDPNGDIGEVREPVRTGEAPVRDVAEILERFTLYIHGTDADVANASDDEAQYQEVRLIFDAVIRALKLHFFGTFKVLSSKYLSGPSAFGSWGSQIRAVLQVSARVPDVALDGQSLYQLVTPYGGSVTANVAVTELDVTETVQAHGYEESK